MTKSAASARPKALARARYWMTLNLAERGPLALLVDDAHWADDASLEIDGRTKLREAIEAAAGGEARKS